MLPPRRHAATAAAASAASLLLALLLGAAVCAAEEGDSSVSQLLKKTSSLFPHPRIGRSGLRTFMQHIPGEKRAAGLFQFPRVGRNSMLPQHQPENSEGLQQEQVLRRPLPGLRPARSDVTRGSGAPSLWFGPRVGRAESAKRRGLLAFPRVGRAGPDVDDADVDAGLWFGPRVGRRERRSLRLRLPAAAWLAAGDVGDAKGDFTPRLGRESGEEDATLLFVGGPFGDADGYGEAVETFDNEAEMEER